MIRQFGLTNSDGESIGLSPSDDLMLYNVDGMGFSRSLEFQRIANRFSILTDKIDQQPINGFIRFNGKNIYQDYTRFVLFAQRAPLVLHYSCDSGDYMQDVVLKELGRVEGGDSAKTVSVTFTPLSLWYREFSVSGTTSVTVISDSENISGCDLTISASTLTNPTWSQTVDGTSVMTGAVTASLTGADLHITTDGTVYRIYADNNGTETDLYGSSDFSTDRFPLIYPGINVFACSSASAITVEGRLEYESI